ncbi:hypothetical protein [Streptomyces sp. MST-110588]|uniref:hypothetical protein n=1 Tax=Streptomyces sp. MST-110588 TaxID=2833628 RepID=UPI001F5C1147|nr:hypothetical protein [Streptomyces sp. MST-110588]UNO38758.1 hypothetical protein KGS77_02730 [Streptomyces sp. MST-110588]
MKQTKRSKQARQTAAPRAHRALRREIPSTAAVLATPRDFAAMRRYRTFTFEDHATYLQQMEHLLHTLSAQGIHTTISLFDPVAYESFCADHALEPDHPASRTRYTAELACTGPTLPYDDRPLSRLLPALVEETERQATWDHASSLLSRAGECAQCGADIARAAFARATRAVTRLMEALGRGTHHLVCSVPADGTPLLAVLHATGREDGRLDLSEAQALIFCTVLATGIALHSPGGIVSRTADDATHDTVRGWSLHDGWLRPLTAGEVFTAYCTDVETGEPVPPEPGVEHLPGLPLPPPPDEHQHR